jgi:hypothetical protein
LSEIVIVYFYRSDEAGYPYFELLLGSFYSSVYLLISNDCLDFDLLEGVPSTCVFRPRCGERDLICYSAYELLWCLSGCWAMN